MSTIFETTEEIYGVLPKTWNLTTLGNLIKNKQADLQTGPFGTMLHASSYRNVGTPVLAVQHIGENRIIHKDDIPRVDEETHQRLARYEIKNSDIIFCRKGAVERTALVTEEEHGWLQGSDCIRLRLLNSNINPVYISYVFCSSQYRKWIVQHAHGATMPSLNQQIINLSPVPVPPLEEQNRIADVLFCLDRKIENLRKQNETLEEIARSIFKHWFIDFEFPNADGKPYKSSGGVMVRSELGDIPEGWNISKIGNEVETVGGGTPSTSEPTYWEDGDIAWYSPTDLTRAKTLFSIDSEKKITKLGLQKSSARLFPKYSLLLTSRATIGEVTISTKDACTNQGFITIIPNLKFSVHFLYGWLSTKIPIVKLLASGSTFPEISKSNFRGLDFIVPSGHILENHEVLIEPIYKKIENNIFQIQTLTKTRDTLLPKLMSGQLRTNI
jgi:type I restriction enzyme, S subunit